MSVPRLNLLTAQLGQANAGLRRGLADVGHVNSPELKRAAGTLASAIRRKLSVRGGGTVAFTITSRNRRVIGGTPSSPGTPPHAQSQRLMKSVKHGPVGAARRVGVLAFYGAMQEQGVNTSLPIRSGRRRRGGGAAKRKLVLPRRPFMEAALEAAKPKMLAGISTALVDRAQGI